MALLVGMITGAYSSIFIAAPLLAIFKQTRRQLDVRRAADGRPARTLREMVVGGSPGTRRASAAPVDGRPSDGRDGAADVGRRRRRRRRHRPSERRLAAHPPAAPAQEEAPLTRRYPSQVTRSVAATPAACPRYLIGNLGFMAADATLGSASTSGTSPTIPSQASPSATSRRCSATPAAFGRAVDDLVTRFHDVAVDRVVGIESRGFILAAPVAYRLRAGFVPVRKAGKLPWAVVREEYELEYGTDKLEIHRDAIHPGERILVVDDVLATGGTAAATGRLIETLGGMIVGLGFLIEIEDLDGRARLGRAARREPRSRY